MVIKGFVTLLSIRSKVCTSAKMKASIFFFPNAPDTMVHAETKGKPVAGPKRKADVRHPRFGL